MSFTIRPYAPSDLEALHAINTASEPGVGAVPKEKLGALIAAGHCLVAADDAGAPAGFVLLHLPEADYDGWNFSWFKERYESFVYVDRIAIAPDARGQSLGQALYNNVFETYAGEALLIGCEVNSTPPNPGSMRFHNRLGFAEVGAHEFNSDYAVTYLARRLS